MDDCISRGEFDATIEKLEAEDSRQNKRLEKLEDNVLQIGELTASVKELTVQMKNMSDKQSEYNDRLKVMESRDGEMWRKVVSYCLTAAAGIIIGFLFNMIGIV